MFVQRAYSRQRRVSTYMTFLSLLFYSFSVSFLFFSPYCPLFHIGDCLRVTLRALLAVARFKFSLAYGKNIPRSHRSRVGRPFVASPLALTPFSLPPPPSLYFSIFLVFRDIGTRTRRDFVRRGCHFPH